MSAITARDQDRVELERRARCKAEPALVTQRAQIILLSGPTMTGNTIYTPVYRGKQTGASGDCQVSARDPGSGRTRWTVPAEHVATVIASAGGVLAMTTRSRAGRWPWRPCQ